MNIPEELQPFGKMRSFFWPIYRHELKKLIPMFVLFFLIASIYNLLRCMKIALIITADGSGAEAVPFLKTGAVLPAAFLLTFLFTKLASRFSRERVFYTMLIGFLAYFAIFLFIMFPYRNQLELSGFASWVNRHWNLEHSGFKGLVSVIRHWNFSIFYVLSEMWSVVVLSMLFWGFANEVTKVNEAKRFYAIFALGANISGIFTGFYVNWMRGIQLPDVSLYPKSLQWVFYQMCAILLMGAVIIALFFWLNKTVFHMDNVKTLQIPKKANKISLRECFLYLKSSKYLACIVVIMVGYNIVFNLADVMFTYKVKNIFVSSEKVNAYMNQITMLTGIIAAVFAFVISGNVIRNYGWTIAALVTPVIWLLTSLGFLSGLIFENNLKSILGIFELKAILGSFIGNPANLVLLLGTIQICLGRGCKYTVFDETKEIAFIPLPKENQRKGKAIVDGIASRFGKSGGSLIYITLFMLIGDVAQIIPYVSGIILICILLWMYAVLGLGKMVNYTIDQEQADEVIEF